MGNPVTQDDHDIWLMRPDIRARLLQLKEFCDYEERLKAGVRDDEPAPYAFSRISECQDIAELTEWLHRAYSGETAAEIFLEPQSRA